MNNKDDESKLVVNTFNSGIFYNILVLMIVFICFFYKTISIEK